MKRLLDFFKRKKVVKEPSLQDLINQSYIQDVIDCCEMEGRPELVKRYSSNPEAMIKLRSILRFVDWNPHCYSFEELDYYLYYYDQYDWVGFCIMEDRNKSFITDSRRKELFSLDLEMALRTGRIAHLTDGDEATQSRAIVRQLSLYNLLGFQYGIFLHGDDLENLCPLTPDLETLKIAQRGLAQENSAIKITSFKTDEEFCRYLLQKYS